MIGAGLGWALSSAANMVIWSLVAQSSNGGGGFFGPGDSTVVYTPLWLPIFTEIVFATLIGLVSGVYPALRAATLDSMARGVCSGRRPSRTNKKAQRASGSRVSRLAAARRAAS